MLGLITVSFSLTHSCQNRHAVKVNFNSLAIVGFLHIEPYGLYSAYTSTEETLRGTFPPYLAGREQ